MIYVHADSGVQIEALLHGCVALVLAAVSPSGQWGGAAVDGLAGHWSRSLLVLCNGDFLGY